MDLGCKALATIPIKSSKRDAGVEVRLLAWHA
jgi:hypothetical protein